jgi:hypothetical protein
MNREPSDDRSRRSRRPGSRQPGSRPQDERFADWVDGRLDEAERARFEAELDDDPELRAAADDYRRTVEALRVALTGEGLRPAAGFADRVLAARTRAEGSLARTNHGAAAPARAVAAPWLRLLPWLGSAAAAAALVAIFLAVRGLGRDPRPEAESVSAFETDADAFIAPDAAGGRLAGGERWTHVGRADGFFVEDAETREEEAQEEEPGASRITGEKSAAAGSRRAGAALGGAKGGEGRSEPGAPRSRGGGAEKARGAGPATPGPAGPAAPGPTAPGAGVPTDDRPGAPAGLGEGGGFRDEALSFARVGRLADSEVPAPGALVFVVELAAAEALAATPDRARRAETDAVEQEIGAAGPAPSLPEWIRGLLTAAPGEGLAVPPVATASPADGGPPAAVEVVDLGALVLALTPAAPAPDLPAEKAEPQRQGLFLPRAEDVALRIDGSEAQRDRFLRDLVARLRARGAGIEVQRAPFVYADRPGGVAPGVEGASADARGRAPADLLVVFRRAAAPPPVVERERR